MPGFKQSRLVAAYSPLWKRQVDFDTPMNVADLTAAMPLLNRRWPGTTLTLEDVRGCTGKHLVDRILTSRVMTWSLEFNVSALLLAGAAALLYGVAAAPTGTPADEVQTITINATGGTFTISFTFEGLTATTPALAWNATAAQVQAALEALRSIKPGNVTVGLAGLVYTVTFAGDLAKANVPALVTNAAGLTGGAATATVATTTPGVQRSHAITRLITDQGPAISVVVGFEGQPETYVFYKSIVAADLRATAARRSIVTAALGVRGSANVQLVPSFPMPPCAAQEVIRASQCRAIVDGVTYTDLVKMEYNSSNGILDGDDAFPFDSADVSRLEVGEQWQPAYGLDLYGSNADALFIAGKALQKKAASLVFGPPGNRVTFSAPSAQLQLSGDELGFSGQANRSTIPLTMTPLEVAGVVPDSVIANIAQATALLTASV